MQPRLIILLCLVVASASAQMTANIATYGGCNNTTSDLASFGAFNTAARSYQSANPGKTITLEIPQGETCCPGIANFTGITNPLIVTGLGTGATFTDLCQRMNIGVDPSIYGRTTTSGRIATASKGATSVTLLIPSQATLFPPGVWEMIAGFDMQGNGYPPNLAFWDYVCVTSSNTITGVVSFAGGTAACPKATPLLQYQDAPGAYKSTWPLYNDLGFDNGGPATIYKLNPAWNATFTFANLTFNLAKEAYGGARMMTYRNITVTGSGGQACPVPSNTVIWNLINSTLPCNVEVDKLIDTINVANSTVNAFIVQSASVKDFNVTGGSIGLVGSPIHFMGNKVNIPTFWYLGASGYGASKSFTCSGCNIAASVAVAAIIDKGGQNTNQIGVNNTYALNNGVIAVPRSYGPVRWAVPGTHAFFASNNRGYGTWEYPFQVIDVTADSNYTYVQTNLSGSTWPVIVPDTSNPHPNAIYIRVHPAPSFTCSACTGSADAVALSKAPPGAPLFSYDSRTFSLWTGTPGVLGNLVNVWGHVVELTYDVTTPYTGVQSSLTLNAGGQYGTQMQCPNSMSPTPYYNPIIDLKIAGVRQVYPPSTVIGGTTHDSGLLTACAMSAGYYLYLPAGIASESPSLGPSITITVQTNQGFDVGLKRRRSQRSLLGDN